MLEWDDLRFVLAVQRGGSTLAAARALKVNQTTVMRRIARIESALGADLFDKRQSGYAATLLGVQVCDSAAEVEARVQALTDAVAARQRTVSGVIRLTTSETLANHVVSPCIGAFQKTHPGVKVQLILDDRMLNVAGGEADVAFRAGEAPRGGGIVARRLPDAAWALYCSRDYAAEHGAPASPAEIDGHRIVGMEGAMGEIPGPRWLEAVAPNGSVQCRCNSLTNLIANLKAGIGVATAPCLMGDIEPNLVRCFEPIPEIAGKLWLIVREDLKAAPHVRAFVDALAAHAHAVRGRLEGTSPR